MTSDNIYFYHCSSSTPFLFTYLSKQKNTTLSSNQNIQSRSRCLPHHNKNTRPTSSHEPPAADSFRRPRPASTMTKRHRLYLLLTLVALLVLLIFSTNFYFIRWLAVDQEHPVPAQVHSRSLVPTVNESDALMKVVGRTASIQQLVETRVVKLKTVFKNRNPRYDPVKRGLVRSFGAKGYNISTVWKIASGVSWFRFGLGLKYDRRFCFSGPVGMRSSLRRMRRLGR